MSDKITILKDSYEHSETGEEVDGLTLIVEGKVKDVFETLMKNNQYNDYTEVMRDIVINGINKMI